jgi:hypothetical protein
VTALAGSVRTSRRRVAKRKNRRSPASLCAAIEGMAARKALTSPVLTVAQLAMSLLAVMNRAKSRTEVR